MAIEFWQKLKFFKISHNPGQSWSKPVETNLPKLKFLKIVCFGYSFNKIYSLRVGISNFQKDESMSLATEKT